MSNTAYRSEWESRVISFKSSGMGVTDWCKANDVKLHRFKYWLYKRKSSNSAFCFSSLTHLLFSSSMLSGVKFDVVVILELYLISRETALKKCPRTLIIQGLFHNIVRSVTSL